MKLSEDLANKFAIYNGLLEKIESEFEHLEPAWNPEGGWYPTELQSNDVYVSGKRYNRMMLHFHESYLEADYFGDGGYISVKYDMKPWTDEQIMNQTDNSLIAYYKPILDNEEMDYLMKELKYRWSLPA